MLSEIFKTQERVKILSCVMYLDVFTVNQISRETGITKGLVSKYLSRLKDIGLVFRDGRIYHLKDNARSRAVRVLLNLDKIDPDSLNAGWALGLGIFGSWARGTNTRESDFDVWVRAEVQPSEQDLARLHRDLRSMVKTEVNLLVLTPEKIEAIRKNDPPFFSSLVYTSLILSGDPIERY